MAGLPVLGIASLALGAVGTGISAIGAMQSASATAAASRYQAQVAANNATIAQQYATSATEAGEAKAEATSLENRQKLGQIGAAQAASGLDVDTGSPVDVRSTQRAIGQLNVENVLQQGQQTAYGYRVQGTNYQAQSGLLQSEAGQAETAGTLNVAGSLVSGASNLGSKYLWMQSNAGPYGGAQDFSGAGSP